MTRCAAVKDFLPERHDQNRALTVVCQYLFGSEMLNALCEQHLPPVRAAGVEASVYCFSFALFCPFSLTHTQALSLSLSLSHTHTHTHTHTGSLALFPLPRSLFLSRALSLPLSLPHSLQICLSRIQSLARSPTLTLHLSLSTGPVEVGEGTGGAT